MADKVIYKCTQVPVDGRPVDCRHKTELKSDLFDASVTTCGLPVVRECPFRKKKVVVVKLQDA